MADDKEFAAYLNTLDTTPSTAPADSGQVAPPDTPGSGMLDKTMGLTHQAMAPFSVPRGLSDIASQGVLGVMNNTGMIPDAPPGSRGAQLSDTKANPIQPTIGGQLGAMGSEAMGVLKGGVPGFAGPPGASSGGGGRLIAATLRNPQINPGIATMAAGVDEIAAYLKRASDEFQKNGEPDKARYAEAARQMLVNGETTAEDVISDPLLFSGALKGVLGKGVEAAGSVFGQAIPGLKTAGNLVGKYAHAVGLPGLAAQGTEAAARAVGGGVGALEGGDPSVAGQGILDLGTQAALASQSSPKDYVTSMTTLKPPPSLDDRTFNIIKPERTTATAAKWNNLLDKIPVVGHGKLTKGVSAYTSSGRLQNLLGLSAVSPEASKQVIDAINNHPEIAADGEFSAASIKKALKNNSGLSTIDIQNVLDALWKDRFLAPATEDPGKPSGVGSYQIADHGEWGYLSDKINSLVTVEHPADVFRATGKPPTAQVPEIPGKEKQRNLPPIKVKPLAPPPGGKRAAARVKAASAEEFADRPKAATAAGEVPTNSPLTIPPYSDIPPVAIDPDSGQAPGTPPPPQAPGQPSLIPGLTPPPIAPPAPPLEVPPTEAPTGTPGWLTRPIATESLLNKGRSAISGGNPPLPGVPPTAEQAPSPTPPTELPAGAKPLPPPPKGKMAKSDSWIADNPKAVDKILKLDRASAANIKEFQGMDKTLVRHILDRVFKKKPGGDEPPPEGGVPLPPPPVPPAPGSGEEGSGPKGPNVLGMATSYGPSGASNTWIKKSKARSGDVDTSGEYMGKTHEWFAPTRLEDVIKTLVREGDITLPEGITPRNLADAVVERHGPKAITQQNVNISKGLEVEGEDRYKYWAQDEINSMKTFGQIVETLKNWGKPLAKSQPIEPTDTSPIEETPTTGIRPYTGPRFTPRQAAKVTQKQANSPERAAFLEEQKAASDKRAAEEKYQAERKARLEEANKKDAEELKKRELEAKIKAGREAKAAQPKGRPSVGRKPDSISPEELIIASASGVPGTQKGRPVVNVPKPTPWEAPLVEDVTGAATPPLPKSLPEPPVQKQFPDQFDYPVRKGPTPGTKTDIISGRTWRPSTSEPVKKNSQGKVTLEGEKVPGIMTSVSPGPEPQRVWKKGVSEEARLTKVGEAQKDPHSLEVRPGHVDAAKAIFSGNKQIQDQLAAAKGETLGEVMGSIMKANKKAGRSNKDLTNRIAPVLAGLSKTAAKNSKISSKVRDLGKPLPPPPDKYPLRNMSEHELITEGGDKDPTEEFIKDSERPAIKEYNYREDIKYRVKEFLEDSEGEAPEARVDEIVDKIRKEDDVLREAHNSKYEVLRELSDSNDTESREKAQRAIRAFDNEVRKAVDRQIYQGSKGNYWKYQDLSDEEIGKKIEKYVHRQLFGPGVEDSEKLSNDDVQALTKERELRDSVRREVSSYVWHGTFSEDFNKLPAAKRDAILNDLRKELTAPESETRAIFSDLWETENSIKKQIRELDDSSEAKTEEAYLKDKLNDAYNTYSTELSDFIYARLKEQLQK